MRKPTRSPKKSRPKTRPETESARQARVLRLIEIFSRYEPDPRCALDHSTPFQLLVATILSAQCTDARVNQVTPKLFARYPDATALAQADLEDLEGLIRPTGFFRSKARHLRTCAATLVAEYGGRVPSDLEALTALPGVGRKTANVVLGNAFAVASGIVVDTHVGRLARRMGLTAAKDPLKVEQDLMKLVPKKDWVKFSHWLILHGRQTCKARRPQCERCIVEGLCPKIF